MKAPIAIQNLIALREHWEEAAEGESLIDVKGSVGLILFDVVEALRLNPEQQAIILGDALMGEIQEYIVMPINAQVLQTV